MSIVISRFFLISVHVLDSLPAWNAWRGSSQRARVTMQSRHTRQPSTSTVINFSLNEDLQKYFSYYSIRQLNVTMETWRCHGSKLRDLLFVNNGHYLIKLRNCLPTWNKRKYFRCSFLSLVQTDQTMLLTGTLLPFIQQQLSRSFIKLSFSRWYWLMVRPCSLLIWVIDLNRAISVTYVLTGRLE